MKSILWKIFLVLCLLMFFVGGYMCINYMRNIEMLLIFLAITVFGLGGIILEAVLIIKRNKKAHSEEEQADEDCSEDNQ